MEGRRPDAGGAARNIYINASNGGVAAYRIDQVIIDGLAELQAAATVLPLAALVVEPTPFVGRESELTRIADLLSGSDGDPSSGIVVVSGPPGVGKTALVRQAATAAAAAGRFDHVLFVDLRGYADDPNARVQPAVVLSKLLILLGVEDAEIAADPAEQAIQYQQRLFELAAEGKSVLLWLDNASDPSQFEPIRPVSPIHRVAVTTRETFGRIPKPQVVDVDVMGSNEAVELLTSAVRTHNPDDGRLTQAPQVTLRLAELCDHLPLALQIVAALLADEPDRPIAELVEELASEEDRLNSLDYGTDLSVRAAFALSYERLPDTLKRLFRLLSVVPGGDIGLVAAGWLISASHIAVRPQLMALVRSHLIQQHVRNRWSMHDLIRLYSAELCAEQPEDAERALKVIVVKYLLASIRGSTPLKFLRADFCRAPVRGQPGAAGLPSFSCGVRSGLAAGGQRAAAAGGLYPMVLHHNVSQCCAHGQWLGRCRIGRRWGRASRAGMVMMRRRRVVPRATA